MGCLELGLLERKTLNSAQLTSRHHQKTIWIYLEIKTLEMLAFSASYRMSNCCTFLSAVEGHNLIVLYNFCDLERI